MNYKIGKYYSDFSTAEFNASGFAEQEKQTIYLHESRIDKNQFQYSLRTRGEIVALDSPNVLREYKYESRGTIKMSVLNQKPKRKYVKRTASIVDSNLPTGLGIDPGDVTEWVTCPTCNGDGVRGEYCFTCEAKGAITESMLADLKSEEANQYQ